MNRWPKKLQEKAKLCVVSPLGNGRFRVDSPSGKWYVVRALTNGGFECSCEWSQYHRTDLEPDSHTIAVEMYLAAQADLSVSVWNSEEDARKQHRQMRQIGRQLIATYRRS